MTGLKYAFEPFGSLESVLSGKPIKIMPLGQFHRDERTLNITEPVLQEMAANFKSGLPRFRVPINENHAGVGKVGTVQDVAFLGDGPDGAGLYATQYELTEAGKKLVTEGRFDAVSPEVVWTLNDGAQYQDPQTGSLHDNVLIGLALTDRPFFGHDQVALFSAANAQPEKMADSVESMLGEIRNMLLKMMEAEMEPPAQTATGAQAEMDTAQPTEESFMAEEADLFKTYDTEQRREMAKNGQALPDGSFPIADKGDLQNAIHALGRGANNPKAQIKAHIVKRAKALDATDMLPPDWEGSTQEKATTLLQEDNMADEPRTEELSVKPEEVKAKPEEVKVKPEEFKALLDKAKQLETLQEQMAATTRQAEEFKVKLAQSEYERDLDRMTAYADGFVALPITATELGKRLLDLKRKDADLFKYFDDLLKTADQLLTQADLFGQRGTSRARTEETFEALIDQVLAEKFGGDKGKYSEAMQIARERRPDLLNSYLNQPRGAR